MSKIMLIGKFDDGVSWLYVDSSLSDVEVTKETIRNIVRDYLITVRIEEGWDMQYAYNFGDIIDEMEQNLEIQQQLAEAGIQILTARDVTVDVFDHDDIWIYPEEVNA